MRQRRDLVSAEDFRLAGGAGLERSGHETDREATKHALRSCVSGRPAKPTVSAYEEPPTCSLRCLPRPILTRRTAGTPPLDGCRSSAGQKGPER